MRFRLAAVQPTVAASAPLATAHGDYHMMIGSMMPKSVKRFSDNIMLGHKALLETDR